jgi:hypothetical protein
LSKIKDLSRRKDHHLETRLRGIEKMNDLKALSDRELADLLQTGHAELQRRMNESRRLWDRINDWLQSEKKYGEVLNRVANLNTVDQGRCALSGSGVSLSGGAAQIRSGPDGIFRTSQS